MVDRSNSGNSSISFLLPYHSILVIDIFRALGDFEENYDIAWLDQLEMRLGQTMEGAAAKALVSDALLLGFGLRRQRHAKLDFLALGSRRATLDEYRLLGLIAAAWHCDFALASRAAIGLDVHQYRPLLPLVADIAKRLVSIGIRFDAPDPRLIGYEGYEPDDGLQDRPACDAGLPWRGSKASLVEG